ncbi:MAG: hypothetical protein JWM30_3957, partial [Burkholderia sp.]|nr:hypothetical protein [Burkholderia sp.]
MNSIVRLPPAPSAARLMPLAAVFAALLMGVVLVALTGVPVGEALSAFADGAWGSPYAIGAS